MNHSSEIIFLSIDFFPFSFNPEITVIVKSSPLRYSRIHTSIIIILMKHIYVSRYQVSYTKDDDSIATSWFPVSLITSDVELLKMKSVQKLVQNV